MTQTPPSATTENPQASGSDSGNQRSEPDFLRIGRVSRPHGLRGELSIQVSVSKPPLLNDVEQVYIGPARVPYKISAARTHRKRLLLRLANVEDRESAEALRGQDVSISAADAEPLQTDEYYIRELIGLQIVTEEGETLGTLTDVLETGANDVYVVTQDEDDWLLPAIKDVIRAIDLERNEMIVHLLPGLRPD